MRSPDEQRVALECLKLSHGNINEAKAMLAFVVGEPNHEAEWRTLLDQFEECGAAYLTRLRESADK